MLALARGNLRRGEELAPGGGISKEELDQRRQTVKQDEAAVDQALQEVHAIRVGLGLPAEPPRGQELTAVPPNLDQNFSTVRQDLATLIQSAAQFGYFPTTWDATPKQAAREFYKHDPLGYTHLVAETRGAVSARRWPRPSRSGACNSIPSAWATSSARSTRT